MAALMVGLRPSDDKRLRQLAEVKGMRPQDLAGIYLEEAIRSASEPREPHQTDCYGERLNA